MKRHNLKVGDQKRYTFDYAELENDTGTENFLDRTISPVESIGTYTLTATSPTGITIKSDSLVDSNTAVEVYITADTVGQWRVDCQIFSSSSPQQHATLTKLFVVQS